MAKKKTTKKKSEGLGDTIAKVTKKTGIDKLVKFVAGEDCGCSSRRERLNKLFPYNSNIKCLQEDEYNILDKYYTEAKPTVTPEKQQELLTIYNRVFHQKMNLTSCSSCFKNNLHKKLERVYKEYNI